MAPLRIVFPIQAIQKPPDILLENVCILLSRKRCGTAADGGYAERSANVYRLKALISREARASQWRALEERYGSSETAYGQKLAAILGLANNIESVENLIQVVAEYGREPTLKATRRVARLARTNPRRHIGTVVTILQEAKVEG